MPVMAPELHSKNTFPCCGHLHTQGNARHAQHFFGSEVAKVYTGVQVLGGAGPAIAAGPLTGVWAGGAFYTLASGLGAGNVGPRGAVQRVGYTFFMAIADVRRSASLCITILPLA